MSILNQISESWKNIKEYVDSRIQFSSLIDNKKVEDEVKRLDERIDDKQNKLITGDRIRINDKNVISADVKDLESQIEALSGTANADIVAKDTMTFRFVDELPITAEDGDLVVIKSDVKDTLYQWDEALAKWNEITPDPALIYFDIDNEVLYTYKTSENRFAEVGLINTYVIYGNYKTNELLKTLKTVGTYNILQYTTSGGRSIMKNWLLTVYLSDDDIDSKDVIYQEMHYNYTISRRSYRKSTGRWGNFTDYYDGLINDTSISHLSTHTWSAQKIQDAIDESAGTTYTAGQNIDINQDNEISALGYTYDTILQSFAELQGSNASGSYSHAEGHGCTASGLCSHAEGSETSATYQCCHAEGQRTTASGLDSHAEGYYTNATEKCAHAEGVDTIANGYASHAEGVSTIAKNRGEHASGAYNISHKNSDSIGDTGNTIYSIGIGFNQQTNKNAFEIMQNGDAYLYGVGNYVGTDISDGVNNVKTLQQVILESTGQQGPQGVTGVEGPQGETGIQGVEGPQGETGIQGVEGPQGETGIQGVQGETGIQGNEGPQGVTGVQGVQGATGVAEITRTEFNDLAGRVTTLENEIGDIDTALIAINNTLNNL